MSIDGQGTLQRRNIAENFNRLSRAHERYRQTTDDRRPTDDRRTDDDYSEHELEFTFAKKCKLMEVAFLQFVTRPTATQVEPFRLVIF